MFAKAEWYTERGLQWLENRIKGYRIVFMQLFY